MEQLHVLFRCLRWLAACAPLTSISTLLTKTAPLLTTTTTLVPKLTLEHMLSPNLESKQTPTQLHSPTDVLIDIYKKGMQAKSHQLCGYIKESI